MKKMIILLSVLFLTGCQAQDNKTCESGYELIDGACSEIVETCEEGFVLVDGNCQEEIICGEGKVYVDNECQFDVKLRTIVPEECQSVDNIGDFQPVWCDEFEEDGLPNPNKWGYDFGGNFSGESQYYTYMDEDNVFVEDGVLHLRAIKESYEGKQYTSARIHSKYSGEFQYGRFQVRAKMPTGKGPLTQIRLFPSNALWGDWRNGGSINFVEYVGQSRNLLFNGLYTRSNSFDYYEDLQSGYTVQGIEEEFHLYEVVWEPGVVRFYVDGLQVKEKLYDPEVFQNVDVDEIWPFDIPFYMVINVAVGGRGGEKGYDAELFPMTLEIDYVRIFQKDYRMKDTKDPSSVSNLRLLNRDKTSLRVAWDHAQDENIIEEYVVYVDDELYGTSTVNAIEITGLDFSTEYKVSVIAKDFANRTSGEMYTFFETANNLYYSGRIEAEDYTTMQGIQLEPTGDTGGGQNVGWVDIGDYLTYRINIAESGNYKIVYRVASSNDGGIIDFYTDETFKNRTTFNTTNGWQNWITVESDIITLESGLQTLKLDCLKDGFNINYFELRRVN